MGGHSGRCFRARRRTIARKKRQAAQPIDYINAARALRLKLEQGVIEMNVAKLFLNKLIRTSMLFKMHHKAQKIDRLAERHRRIQARG